MEAHIREWLARSGFPADAEIASMTPGLGSTMLWRISSAGSAEFVLRVFPTENAQWRDREVLAMQAVMTADLPVPAVIRTGTIGNRPAMLTTLVPGTTVAAALQEHPDQATATGRKLGVLLGEINRLPAPEGLAPPDQWLDRAGTSLAPLRGRLAALPHADRLLHLDFHPENVMIDGADVTGIIDWTNTLPGPPHIDLGRSRAILRLIGMLPDVPREIVTAVDAFAAGLVEGHASIHGPDPEPDLTLAWGVATQCIDFAPQAALPESWVTPELLAQLESSRDQLIAGLLGTPDAAG